ncbi:hypothetical protein [Sphingomonas sp. G-3-2-10]|uniref:hypothetical protein n=1 Tax=Sphingomonas sp. G-3-2-10 TaxID=2728838 RepID=UPI00146AA9BF|nr:hypothetical protein [Sphingomonas sp. G-3-2-10]NML04291.1 hypothetical protein [Sphingomonas sp. G-3-2-10]
MSIDAAKLYEELGRAAAQVRSAEERVDQSKAAEKEAIREVSERFKESNKRADDALEKARSRLRTLKEAARLHEDEGMDPLLAKLAADDSTPPSAPVSPFAAIWGSIGDSFTVRSYSAGPLGSKHQQRMASRKK